LVGEIRDKEMGALHGIYEDVLGAPFRIGQHVRVVAAADETIDTEYIGKVGVVAYFEYTCGCGQGFPDDPMIGVRFGTKTAEFWKEELIAIGHNKAFHKPIPDVKSFQ